MTKTKVEPKKATEFTIESNYLIQLLNVVFAADDTSSRYAIDSVLLVGNEDGLTSVATDGVHMAKHVCSQGPSLKEPFEVILDQKGVWPLLKALPKKFTAVEVRVFSNKCEFDFHKGRTNHVLSCAFVEGRFPRWKEVFSGAELQNMNSSITGNAQSLLADLPTSDKQVETGWILNTETKEFTKKPVDLTRSAKITGRDTVRLNVDRLAQWLGTLPDVDVTINLAGPESMVYCTATNGSSYVLMPMCDDR